VGEKEPMGGSTATGVRRWLRITLRTAHIAAFSTLVGGHVFATPADSLRPWLYAAVASGGLLVATYVYQTGWRWAREIRGAAILGKIALLCVIPFWWSSRVPILFAVIVASSYVSHMPGRYRYWVIGRGPPAE
jgi:hypothetical protein